MTTNTTENNTSTQTQFVVHPANSRGKANHGWLVSNHSFSFADYYNPQRIHFGALRVLNDDWVAAGKGFGRHPHDNMEIISIPLEGALEHTDSMGNTAVIKKGDVQVMSAGTGIFHAEYNKSQTDPVSFLQIWVFPNKKNVAPRYDQIAVDLQKGHNRFQQVLSPDPNDDGVWVHQDAWFHLGHFDQPTTVDYKMKKSGNGLYVFVLEGAANVEGQSLGKRDGMGIWNTDSVSIETGNTASDILLMEVPMKF